MKQQRYMMFAFLFMVGLAMAFSRGPANDVLSGAWEKGSGNQRDVIVAIDGYLTHTTYDREGKRFLQTRGGTYKINGSNVVVDYEFDTRTPDAIGKAQTYSFKAQQNNLAINLNGTEESFRKTDAGDKALAGLWKITARQQEGGLVPIHQSGTRKTIKILSATRFQWAAIDPGAKSFSGTGGGTYTFENGKYTEHIEFFSRDSSRVGQSLQFDGKLQEGDWHHSGKSSRGEPIYEVWSRSK